MTALSRYKERCSEDLTFCFASEYKIRSVDVKNGRFALVPFDIRGRATQVALLAEYEKQMADRGFVRIIIDKSRKEGCSTEIQALAIHHCQTHPQSHAITVAHETKSTRELFRIGSRIVEGCDPNVLPVLKSKPKGHMLEWANGSRAECQTQGGSADSERGSTPTFLHISELPSWETRRRESSAADVCQAMLNAVPDVPGTVIIIESTAKGVGNLFHQMWMRAIKNERGNTFVPMFFSWKDNAEYSSPHPNPEIRKERAWLGERLKEAHESGDVEVMADMAVRLEYSQLQAERAVEFGLAPPKIRFWQQTLVNKCNSDQDRFDEEWPLSWEISFVSSGRSVFSGQMIQRRLAQVQKLKPPTSGSLIMEEGRPRIIRDGGGWEFYKLPQKDHRYVLTADAAGGGRSVDDDFAAIQVFDRVTKEQAAEFYSKVTPDFLAEQLAVAAMLYNEGIMVPECNNHGLLVIHYLVSHHAQRMLYRRFSEPGKIAGTETNKLGYSTDTRTRHYMFGLFEGAVRRGELTLYSQRLLGEMLTLIRNKTSGRPEAAFGYNDDASIAMCIAVDVDKQLAEQGVSAIEDKPKESFNRSGHGFAQPFNPKVAVDYLEDEEAIPWF
jgi:hypothetical protein